MASISASAESPARVAPKARPGRTASGGLLPDLAVAFAALARIVAEPEETHRALRRRRYADLLRN